MRRILRASIQLASLSLVATSASAFTITPNFINGTALQKSQVTQAVSDWSAILGDPTGQTVSLTINITFSDLGTGDAAAGTGQGGVSSTFVADANMLPNSVNITLNSNTDLMYYDADLTTAVDIPANRRDALGVSRHEIGHALGFSANPDGYAKWDACLDAGVGFGCNLVSATMAGATENGRSHLDATAHPGDLMNISVLGGPGSRRAISQQDKDMLIAAFAYTMVMIPEPSSALLLAAGLSLLSLRRRRGPA